MAAFDRPPIFRILHAPPLETEADPAAEPDDGDGDDALELDDEHLEALRLDDDYEPQPEKGDFWTESDAA